jgi:hypothetical protein
MYVCCVESLTQALINVFKSMRCFIVVTKLGQLGSRNAHPDPRHNSINVATTVLDVPTDVGTTLEKESTWGQNEWKDK